MKFFPLLFSFLFSSIILLAQGPKALPTGTANDPNAKALLDAVSKKYKSLSSVKASFKLMIENTANKVKETKTGTLSLKGPKYKVVLENQEITCDNKTVWTLMKDAKEVQVSDYEPDNKSISPNKIFTMYESGFSYVMAELVTENGKPIQVIDLAPLDKAKSYYKIKLFIDKSSSSIIRTKIFDKNGNRYTYEIAQFTPNPGFDEAYFSFDPKKNPGIEVVDLR